MTVVGGAIMMVVGLAFLLFGLYQISDVKQMRGREYSRTQAYLMSQTGLTPPSAPPAPPSVAGGLILLLLLGLIFLILGGVLLYVGLVSSRDNMYPFNYGTAFPVHSEPGVLTEEVIGNLL